MGKSFIFWVIWFVFLLTLDFWVPFWVLKDVPRLSGSFLFWNLWMLAAVVSMFVMFLNWREDQTPNSRE
ncbi:MAG: hypothetical protein PVI06_15490 [Desulfobacterales bacterium]